ncbi:hypothetical protein D9M70_429200 [compost metagenome]
MHVALHLLAGGIHEVVEHRQDQAAFVTHHHRHGPVHLLTLRFVQLGAGLEQDLVEIGALEAGIVPVGVREIGGGIHLVLGRAAAPVGRREGLDVPDVCPVAVARFALDLDFDAGLLGAFLVEHRRVDRAWEGDVGGAQQHRAAMAGLLVVEGRLVRVIGALLDALREEGIGVVDREVVADLAIAAEDALDHGFAIHRVFQRQPQVVVVERRRVAMHDEHVVAAARRVQDLDSGRPLQQVDRLRIDSVDEVHLAGGEGGDAGRRIVHGDQFDGIDIATIRAPVVGILFEGGANAGFEARHLVGAGADHRVGTVETAVRLDDKVVVGQQQRQVGIAFRECQHELAAVGLDFLDRLHHAECARFRLVIGVALQRLDDVVERQLLAVVELHALADVEGPGRCVGRGLPGFGKCRHRCACRRMAFDQHVAPVASDDEHELRKRLGRVLRVGGGGTFEAELQMAAALRLLRRRAGRKQRAGRRGENAGSGCAAEKLAPVHLAEHDLLCEVILVIAHSPVPFFVGIRRSLWLLEIAAYSHCIDGISDRPGRPLLVSSGFVLLSSTGRISFRSISVVAGTDLVTP